MPLNYSIKKHNFKKHKQSIISKWAFFFLREGERKSRWKNGRGRKEGREGGKKKKKKEGTR